MAFLPQGLPLIILADQGANLGSNEISQPVQTIILLKFFELDARPQPNR